MKEHLGLWEEERGDQKMHRPPGKPLVSPLLWLLKYYTLLELANPTRQAMTNPARALQQVRKRKVEAVGRAVSLREKLQVPAGPAPESHWRHGANLLPGDRLFYLSPSATEKLS